MHSRNRILAQCINNLIFAVLAVADGLFVESSLISSTVFYGDIAAVANILPGSILCKALTAIGYTFHLYECFSDFRSTQTLSHYIGPIICGLLGTVILALLVSIKEIL